jgi:hypothetical protein
MAIAIMIRRMIIAVVIGLTYTLSWVQLAIKKYWEQKIH